MIPEWQIKLMDKMGWFVTFFTLFTIDKNCRYVCINVPAHTHTHTHTHTHRESIQNNVLICVYIVKCLSQTNKHWILF